MESGSCVAHGTQAGTGTAWRMIEKNVQVIVSPTRLPGNRVRTVGRPRSVFNHYLAKIFSDPPINGAGQVGPFTVVSSVPRWPRSVEMLNAHIAVSPCM